MFVMYGCLFHVRFKRRAGIHLLGTGIFAGAHVVAHGVEAVFAKTAGLHNDVALGQRAQVDQREYRAVGRNGFHQGCYILRQAGALAMLGQTWAQAHLPPTRSAIIMTMEPVFAATFAVLLGGDIDPERVDAARKNVRGTRKKPTAGDKLPDIRQWDARHLPLEDASVDKIATNPPFGKQLRGTQTPAKLYPPILAELQRVVRPGGRIVLLTSEYDLIKEEVRKLPRLTITTGYSVAVLGVWGRIYIIDVA